MELDPSLGDALVPLAQLLPEATLQFLWTSLCPRLHLSRSYRGKLESQRTTELGEDLHTSSDCDFARLLPRRHRQPIRRHHSAIKNDQGPSQRPGLLLPQWSKASHLRAL